MTPIKVGITGGIGSGKSIISTVFRKLGVPIYNSDDRGKYLTKTNKNIAEKIKEHFGDEYYDSEGSLLTQKLGSLVFNNEEKLKLLNSIVHPEVALDFKQWLEAQRNEYILKESAIIFENGIEKSLDIVISVICPLELRIKNILKRDPFRTEDNIRAIISRQMSDDEKIIRSDYVIHNDEKSSVLQQVLNIHHTLLQHGRL